MVRVINPKHPLFNKTGKIQDKSIFSDLDENIVPLLIEDEIFFIKTSDIEQTNKKKQRLPYSRKDFYSYIQDEKTTKKEIVEMISQMIITVDQGSEKNMLVVVDKPLDGVNYSKELLFAFILDEDNLKSFIVDEIRNRRDNGFIELNLPNNNITAGVFSQKPKKSHKNNNFNS